MQAIVDAQLQMPFNLEDDMLIRASLIKVDEREHVLLVHMHHIVTDGWSFGVQNREFAALYNAFAHGLTDPLPPLRIQYSDYASWQRETLEDDVLASKLEYWKHTLSTVQNSELARGGRPAVRSYNGDTVHFALEAQLWQQIEALCTQYDVTPYMFMLTAFSALLRLYSGQTDITVGSPVANRDHASIEGLIGFFVNTLALRQNLESDPTFVEFLQRVKETTLGAFEHLEAPFEKVVDVLNLPRDVSRTPVFQVLFVFQNAPSSVFELPGLIIEAQEIRNRTSKFDLTFNLTQAGAQMAGRFEYCTELFSRTAVEAMVQHFNQLLKDIVAHPEKRVSELDMMAAEEKGSILQQCRGAVANYSDCTAVTALFQRQVERWPNKVAAVCNGMSLTYRELNEKANQVAHYLVDAGLCPGGSVALFLERSLDIVIAILGIHKAGGAYVPIDPKLPAARVSYIVEDSGAIAVITHSATLERLPAIDVTTVSLESIQSAATARSLVEPGIPIDARSLAYVIYTSGSTGQPKGVMIEHGNLLNYVQSITTTLALTGEEKGALATLVATDLGNTVLFPMLCTGGELHIVSEDCIYDLEKFTRYISNHQISFLKMTPSHFAVMAEKLGSSSHLASVVLGGERISTSQLRNLVTKLPHCRFFNHYGPTETCVGATVFPVRHIEDIEGDSVPIGKPLANINTYVIDDRGQLAPVGVPGELYIGGAGVARGYLNRPDLNDVKFVSAPFATADRVYRSGDQVRRLTDGNLEFIGRLDDQVKVRGYRIELGEIESAICLIPGVAEGVVLVRPTAEDSHRLEAYVVVNNGALTRDDIRRMIQQQLPDYMVPSVIERVSEFPRLGSGKVDRKSLLAFPPDSQVKEQRVLPANNIEQELEAIFCYVLKLTAISVTDNFFSLGGHSLEAVVLVSKINAAFGVSIDLPTLFGAATVRAMAKFIERQETIEFDVLVGIQPQGDQLPIFAVPGAGGNVLGLYELAQALGPDQPFYGLQSIGLDGVQPPLESVEKIALKNIEAIRRVQQRGPYKLLGHSFGGYVVYEMALRLIEQGEEVALVALYDVWPPDYTANGRRNNESSAMLINLCAIIAEYYGVEPPISEAVLSSLPEKDYFRYITESFAKQGVSFYENQIKGIWNVYSTNVTMHYEPEFLLESDHIVLCRARDNHSLQGRNDYFDRVLKLSDYGWAPYVRGGVYVHDVPGDHETLLRAPNVAHLPPQLQRSLDVTPNQACC
ncbi:non-ribosomal peptide synthetase [Pseudomonas frederiksbergensis]|uniref:non-ribosomal peptide synthetase n=1 Tax=Pseudomonas frederiksbergensis TaxID=104087 RepID=UPI003D1909A2